MVIKSTNVPRIWLLTAFLGAAALAMTNCGSVEPSPTAPSPTVSPSPTPAPAPSPAPAPALAPAPAPAPAPSPTPQPSPSSGGVLQVTISPNPVPWSGNLIANCSLTNTWTYTQILDNVGSAELTISDRTDYFDGALFSQKSGLGIVIPAGSKTSLTTRFCSANSFEHHTRTDFSGSDSKNNRINYKGPEVTLSK
jgi:hypothetical protein